MSRTFSQSESCSPFLEPPHRHDPTSVSLLSTLPPCVMDQLPEEVQIILWDLQESTCVAYASYERLEDLVDERFERLMPSVGPDGTTFSESSWFNYSNQFQAEHDYLFSEALPDWHQKASTIQRVLQPYFGTPFPKDTTQSSKSVGEWWTAVHDCVAQWLESSKGIVLPEFDDIVEDYLSGRHETAIYETPDLSPVGSHQNKIHSSQKHTPIVAVMDVRHEQHTPFQVSSKVNEVMISSVDLRKDSGISMVAA